MALRDVAVPIVFPDHLIARGARAVSRRSLSPMGLAISLAVAACSDGTGTGSKAPPTVAVVSGDSQAGEVGRPLGQPLVVGVTAASGLPDPNVTVSWAVAAGGGLLSSPATITGADGQASVSYALGATPGENRVSASVPGATGSPVTFRVTALRRGDIDAFVVDTAGRPIPGVTVRLRPGGGSIDLRVQVTDAAGRVAFLDVTGGDYDVRIDVPAAYTLDGQPNPVGATVLSGGTTIVSFVLVSTFPTLDD